MQLSSWRLRERLLPTTQSETPVLLKIPFETLPAESRNIALKPSPTTDPKTHRPQGPESRREFGLWCGILLRKGLLEIEWAILGGQSGGSMQERTLRRRYSSSCSP